MTALFAPRGEFGEKAAVDVRRCRARVGADFLEVHGERSFRRLDLGEPPTEAQERHAAAFEATSLERHGTADDRPTDAFESPPSRGAEIERKQRARIRRHELELGTSGRVRVLSGTRGESEHRYDPEYGSALLLSSSSDGVNGA
jgi:hypothetical protein